MNRVLVIAMMLCGFGWSAAAMAQHFDHATRGELIDQARQGNPIPLQQAVREDEILSQDLELMVVLARSLVKTGQIDNARENYRKYLSQRAADFEVYLEYLYTYVWEENTAEGLVAVANARQKFAAEQQQQQLDVVAQKLNKPAAGESKVNFLGLQTSFYQNSDSLRRESRQLSWRKDYLQVDLASHKVSSKPYFRTQQNTLSEAKIGLRIPVGGFRLTGGGGVYAAGAATYSGYGIIETPEISGFRFRAGALRSPFALFIPLHRDDLTLMDELAVVGVRHGWRLNIRGEFHSVEDYAPFQKYFLLAQEPVYMKSDVYQLRGRLRVESQHHQRVNPFYFAPRQATLTTLGIAVLTDGKGPMSLAGYGDFGLVYMRNHDRDLAPRQIQYYEFSLKGMCQLNPALELNIELFKNNAEDGRLNQSTYNSQLLTAGVKWQYDGEESDAKQK